MTEISISSTNSWHVNSTSLQVTLSCYQKSPKWHLILSKTSYWGWPPKLLSNPPSSTLCPQPFAINPPSSTLRPQPSILLWSSTPVWLYMFKHALRFREVATKLSRCDNSCLYDRFFVETNMCFNCCFNSCFRDSSDQKRLVQDARQRYEEIVGKENSFAKEITSVIDNYVSFVTVY